MFWLVHNDRDVSMQRHCVSETIHLEDQGPRKFKREHILVVSGPPVTPPTGWSSSLPNCHLRRRIQSNCRQNLILHPLEGLAGTLESKGHLHESKEAEQCNNRHLWYGRPDAFEYDGTLVSDSIY